MIYKKSLMYAIIIFHIIILLNAAIMYLNVLCMLVINNSTAAHHANKSIKLVIF